MRGSKTASIYFRWTCSIFLGHAFLPIEAGRSINRLSLSWVLLQDSQPDHEVSIGPIRGPPCMASIKLVNRSLFLRLTSMLDCCNNNFTWKKNFAKKIIDVLDMQLRKVIYFFSKFGCLILQISIKYSPFRYVRSHRHTKVECNPNNYGHSRHGLALKQPLLERCRLYQQHSRCWRRTWWCWKLY